MKFENRTEFLFKNKESEEFITAFIERVLTHRGMGIPKKCILHNVTLDGHATSKDTLSYLRVGVSLDGMAYYVTAKLPEWTPFFGCGLDEPVIVEALENSVAKAFLEHLSPVNSHNCISVCM